MAKKSEVSHYEVWFNALEGWRFHARIDCNQLMTLAPIFGFKKARIEKLRDHTSVKYNYIWKKDWELRKIFKK